jgi:hypothetical protein
MPNNNMQRFTQRCRRVLSLAQEQAERLRHNYIGTEHLLLGLLREEGGVAGRVLRDLGLERQRVEELVEELTRATARTSANTPELSPITKRVLELAVDEARRMGHHAIGTEHLLLGLVQQSDGVAIDVLKRLDVSPEAVRQQTRRVLQEKPTQTDALIENQPEPKQPMARLSSDAYDMLQNVLVKILDMIESGKLSVAQGVELFNTLTPDLKLAPGQQAELVNHLFDQKKFNGYSLHLKLTSPKVRETLAETDLPLTTFLKEIDRFLAAVLNEPDSPLVFHLGDNNIELRIVNDKDKPDE